MRLQQHITTRHDITNVCVGCALPIGFLFVVLLLHEQTAEELFPVPSQHASSTRPAAPTVVARLGPLPSARASDGAAMGVAQTAVSSAGEADGKDEADGKEKHAAAISAPPPLHAYVTAPS